MTDRPATAPVASVVIPAHDEGTVIGRCLRALVAGSSGPLDVVVAANGCSDDTVAVARSVPGVRVLDLPTPSKVAALNAGDEAALAYPRIYLDADITLGDGALDHLVAALSTEGVVAAAPHVRFHDEDASWPVRAFYDVFRRLPYVTDNLLGLGVYGLSRAARERFGPFPDVLGDDLYVQRLFSADERVVVPGTFDVQVPRTLAALLKVRTRVAKGNAELAARDEEFGEADLSRSTEATSTAIVALLRQHPTLLPQVAVYVLVGVVSRARARRASRATWERDASTR